MRFAIGQPVSRTEDPRLLKGRGRYLDDLPLRDVTRAYILRSPHAHARIRSIDTEAAKAMPGVLLVLTGAEYRAEGLGDLKCSMPLPIKRADGSPFYAPTRTPIAVEKARYVGDAVALVVAETLNQAKDAAEAVEVNYEPLPAVTDAVAAAADGAPRVWDDCAGNECFLWEEGDKAAVDAAFAKAATVVRQRLANQRITAATMEPRSVAGYFDPMEERFTLYAGVQRPHTVRNDLAENVFRLPEHRFRVLAFDIGGGFGMRGGTYPEDPLILWAARKLGRAVKWVPERSESLLADHGGRDDVFEAELALDADGRFLALRLESWGALGAYLATMGPQPKIGNLGGLAGVYTTPAIHVRVHGMFTNASPIQPYRGSGRPEAAYVMERLVDKAARQTGVDPAELRRRNLIPADAFPYKTALSFTYDCGEFEACLDKALALADYSGFEARREEARARGKLRGLGLAMMIEQAGGRSLQEFADLRFEPSGTATLRMGTANWGMGHDTAYKQLVSDWLGLPAESLRVVEGDTDAVPFGLGSFGSRCLNVGASAIHAAAQKLIAKGRRIAAHLLEAAEADIEFADGRFSVAGTDRALTIQEIARTAFQPLKLPPDMEASFSELGVYTPLSSNFPNGCHLCEVEIDPETGVVKVVRYSVVDDVGTVVNPLLLKGQVHGGVAQGLGQVLGEHMVFDPDSGQPVSASFMDYMMPRADDICSMQIETHSVPTPTNPVGTKGAGEAGTVGAVPAAVNAICDALAPLGVEHVDMPATPERLWRAIRRAEAANN